MSDHTIPLASRKPIGVAQQHATRVGFLIAGLGMSVWAPLVPYAVLRIGMDDATLGLLLLCLGIGSICAMPMTGSLAERFGCRAVIICAAIFIMLCLPLLATVPSIMTLGIMLFIFGASVGTIDVAINIQAVLVEKASGKPMMSGFHGLYSLGCIIGAGGVSLLLTLGIATLTTTLASVACIILLLLFGARHMLPYANVMDANQGHQEKSPIFILPRGKVAFIGILCFICFLVEGAILDWSAVFLTTVKNFATAEGGIGFTLFAFTMTFGRLTGDLIVKTFGNFKVLLAGSLTTATGLALVVYGANDLITLVGFALIGLGASNIVPILFSAAGNQSQMSTNLAITAVTTMGYLGILAGPALIGFISHAISLSFAFSAIAVLMLVITGSARYIVK